MRYQITGKQMDVGEALQTHVKAELAETVEKYAKQPTDATVVFSRNAYEYVCEATVHLSTGLNASASGRATEVYPAFEACREKLDKQLRRYKRRLKDHHNHRTQPVEYAGAASYILASEPADQGTEPETLAPMIIAEMETKLPTLSVGEAVMQMELAGKKMLVFRNEKNGAVNVIHMREDGNVGWIDPRN